MKLLNKILLISAIHSAVYAQQIESKLRFNDKQDSKQRWFEHENKIEKEQKKKGIYVMATYHLPKTRSEHALFIDLNNDGILEASRCYPWDYHDGGRLYGSFFVQSKNTHKLYNRENKSGWDYSRDVEGMPDDFSFLLSQLYEIKKNGKSHYFIFDDSYGLRQARAENIEEYLFQHYQDDESPPKGYQGSPGYIPPSREELVKEFSEADVLLWEKAGKQKIPRDPKENITAKYLEKNWEKHTLTELYMNDRKNQVKGRLVKTVEDFKALLKDGEWQQADVTVEKYQWAYAKEIAVIGEYYDKAKQQPVMLNVGVKDELVKVLEFGPHRETKIFTKEGKVPLKKYKEGHLK